MYRTVGLLASLLACAAFAQDPPASKTWSIGPQGENVQTTVTVTWAATKTGVAESHPHALYCYTPCRGKKHVLHEQCDPSCDGPCPTVHKSAYRPGYWLPNMTEVLQKAVDTFGIPDPERGFGPGLMGVGPTVMGWPAISSDPKNTLQVSLSCWNDSPCSANVRSIESDTYEGELTYQFERTTFLADGTPVRTLGPKVTVKASYEIPLRVKPGPGTKKVFCQCTIVRGTDDEVGFLDGQATDAYCHNDDETHALGDKEFAGLGLGIVGQDMGTFTVAVGTPPPGCDKLVVPAGWEFVCVDGSLQDTLLVQDATFMFARGAGGPRLYMDPTEVRTLCLNIAKKEPAPGVAYRLVPPRDPFRVAAARMTRDSRFGGPWDQVRLWVLTDRAGLDQIEKVLFPPPSERMYLRELHRLVDANLIGLDAKADAKVVDKRLLLAKEPDEEAMRWFVAWLLENDKDKTLGWIKANAGKFAALLKEDKGETGVSVMTAEMVSSGDPDAARAALDLLLHKSLADVRGKLTADPVQAEVCTLLVTTEDAALAGRVLDYIEACKPTGWRFACANVAEGLPQAVKDRAAKVQ